VEGLVYVQAKVSRSVDSVTFEVPGQFTRTESTAPYAMRGDDASGLLPWDTTTVADGRYALTVTAEAADGAVATKAISFAIQNPEPEAEPEPEPAPQPTASGPTLQPGSGFTSAPSYELSSVGKPGAPGYDRIAVARWDVIPEQKFEGQFAIGVVAHHIYGIASVRMSVDNGPWVSIGSPSINPRTKVEEYWAYLDASKFGDGKVEVRAIAYPANGKPKVLEPLELFANAGGSIKFPVLELGAGTHSVQGVALPKEGWLTIRPKPGVSREQCIIKGDSRGWGAGNVRFADLTLNPGAGGGALMGTQKGVGRTWLDRVKVVGNGNANPTWWLAHMRGNQYYTDCQITAVQNVMHTTGGQMIMRNCHIYDTYEDICRANGLMVNVKIERIHRGAQTSYHSDVFQWHGWTPTNFIAQDVQAIECRSQGIFVQEIADSAFVRLDLHTIDSQRALQMEGHARNVLIKDTFFRGGSKLRVDKGFSADQLVLHDIVAGFGAPYLPDNWQEPGVVVLPQPGNYD